MKTTVKKTIKNMVVATVIVVLLLSAFVPFLAGLGTATDGQRAITPVLSQPVYPTGVLTGASTLVFGVNYTADDVEMDDHALYINISKNGDWANETSILMNANATDTHWADGTDFTYSTTGADLGALFDHNAAGDYEFYFAAMNNTAGSLVNATGNYTFSIIDTPATFNVQVPKTYFNLSKPNGSAEMFNANVTITDIDLKGDASVYWGNQFGIDGSTVYGEVLEDDGSDADYTDGKLFHVYGLNLTDATTYPVIYNSGNINQSGHHTFWMKITNAGLNYTYDLWFNAMYDNFYVGNGNGNISNQSAITISVDLTYVNNTLNATDGVPAYLMAQFDGSSEGVPLWMPDAGNDGDLTNGETYTVTAPPEANISGGMHTVQFNTTEGWSGANISSLVYTFWVNENPEITTTSLPDATAMWPYTVNFAATDADNDVLTWYVDATNVNGYSFDNNTGVFSWTPTDSDVGSHYINISVDDNNGSVAYKNLTFNVLALETGFYNPMVDPTSGQNLATYNFTTMYRDVQERNLTNATLYIRSVANTSQVFSFQMEYNTSVNLSGNLSTGVEFWHAEMLGSGDYEYSFNFSTEDGNYTVSDWFYGPHVDTPPVLSDPAMGPQWGNSSTTFIFNINYTDADDDMPNIMNLTIYKDSISSPGNLMPILEVATLGIVDYDLANHTYTYLFATSIPANYSGTFYFSFYTENDFASASAGPYGYFFENGFLDNFTVNASKEADPISHEYPVDTVFGFNVWFYHYDNISADMVNLSINGQNYTMQKVNATDNNTLDGVLYTVGGLTVENSALQMGTNMLIAYADSGNGTQHEWWVLPTLAIVSNPNGIITGHVNDTTGANLTGVHVNVQNTTGPVTSAITDTNGNYTTEEIPAGTYNVSFSMYGYENSTKENVVVPAAGQVVVDATMTPWELGDLTVNVMDSDGNNISGATVVVSSGTTHDGYTFNTVTKNDVTNTTTIEDLPLVFNDYTVNVSAEGYIYNETTVTMTTDGVVLNVVLANVPPATGTLSGMVKDADGNGIANATVSNGSYTATTDANGNYTITNITVGTYNFTASAEGYVDSTVEVTIEAGANTQDFTLEEVPPATGTLSGMVKDADGNGIANATVSNGSYTATTDENGSYTIENIMPGTYNFTASADGYVDSTMEVTIEAGANTQDFTLSPVPPTTGTLTGSVNVDNATVTIEGTTLTATVTNGTYTITGIAPGTYNVTVTADGYESQTKNVTIVAGQTATLNFTLVATTTTQNPVTFTLGPFKDKDGNAIEGATITIKVDGQTYTGTTDKDGMVSFTIPAEHAAGLTGTLSGTFKDKDYNDGKEVDFTFNGAGATNGATVSPTLSKDIVKNPAQAPNNTLLISLVVLVIIVIAIVAFFALKKKPEEGEVAAEEEAMAGYEEGGEEECECPNCGAAVSCTAEACPECGEEFVEGEFRCPSCGATVSAEDTVCPNCGEEFGVEEEEVEIEEEEEGAEEEEEGAEEEEEEDLFEDEAEAEEDEEEFDEEEEEEDLFEDEAEAEEDEAEAEEDEE